MKLLSHKVKNSGSKTFEALAKKMISDLITEAVSKLGENIIISRFSRFQLGEKVND